MNVIEYCTEEVRRQRHDVTAKDGIERVCWMLNAWLYAMSRPWPDSRRGRGPRLSRIETLGKLVEMEKNADGFRTVGVRVGTRICPPASEVEERLERLCDLWPIPPMDFYKEFEMIHPFVDGNERVGKILLNALNGTLLNPIFPPNDLFGVPITNP